MTHVSLVSLLSSPIKTSLLGPVLCNLYSVCAMASQSSNNFICVYRLRIRGREGKRAILGFSRDARGNDVDLSQYKGKMLLMVNVASQWYALAFRVLFFFLDLLVPLSYQVQKVGSILLETKYLDLNKICQYVNYAPFFLVI
ncbi:hypothetical protein I3760_11G125600 [Carya illinoinensis]|nr:hypothetical protein I3760_11G125600 [Carya illinoinensis]